MSSQKRKVLHFIDSGGLYGAENVIIQLSGEMAASDRYEPVVGCIVSHRDEHSDLYDKAAELGYSAERTVIRNALLVVDLPKVANRLKKMNVQLIHAHGYKAAVFGFAIKLMTGIEVLSTCHLWSKEDKWPLKMRVMVALELALYRFFEVVVGVSEPIVDVLINAGVPSEKTRVIKNGVEVGKGLIVDPDTLTGLRQELGLGSDEYCILNTGRLTRQKAHNDLIAAAAIVRDRSVDCRFLIAGTGELEDQLQRQIAEANLGSTVELLGFRANITALLQMADLFVLPSLDEGMPMSLLEAAAVGLPVVVTPVGDIPKLIEDNVTGLVVPAGDPQALADAIATLKENPELSRRLGAAAQQFVEKLYSNEAMFASYDTIYMDLLE